MIDGSVDSKEKLSIPSCAPNFNWCMMRSPKNIGRFIIYLNLYSKAIKVERKNKQQNKKNNNKNRIKCAFKIS